MQKTLSQVQTPPRHCLKRPSPVPLPQKVKSFPAGWAQRAAMQTSSVQGLPSSGQLPE